MKRAWRPRLKEQLNCLPMWAVKLKKSTQWGKRRFAYEIEDNTEGFYVVIDFQAEGGATSEVERHSQDHP